MTLISQEVWQLLSPWRETQCECVGASVPPPSDKPPLSPPSLIGCVVLLRIEEDEMILFVVAVGFVDFVLFPQNTHNPLLHLFFVIRGGGGPPLSLYVNI